MPASSISWPLLRCVGEFVLGHVAQARLGLLGAVLLVAITVSVRSHRTGLAVGTAVVFTLLMAQA